jgi:hypothetical protein
MSADDHELGVRLGGGVEQGPPGLALLPHRERLGGEARVARKLGASGDRVVRAAPRVDVADDRSSSRQ